MKKKLTKNSFSALRKIATVLDEQQQRAVVGGDYWDDHGIWQIDSNGNSYWTRTSQGDQYYGGSGYGGGSGYYGGSGYGGNSGYGTNSGVITQEQFFNWSGDWPGGYVEGMGYVPPDTIIYGGSGYYGGSGSYGDSGNNSYFSINNAVEYLLSNANENSIGKCAAYVREAIVAGGLFTTGHPTSACDYDTFLITIGFSEVDSSNYTPQAGDIIVHSDRTNHEHGHIAMYSGENWISDFVQKDMYGGSAYRNNPNYTILRWEP